MPTPPLTRVLERDPALGADLPAADTDQALLLAVAPTVRLAPGPWRPGYDGAGHLGLLVLDGIVMRSARLVEHDYVELLGTGDLLRPWQDERSAPFLPGAARWDILTPTEIAVLDRRFTSIAGRWPDLIAALAERAVRRSRSMALGLAVAQVAKIEVRLLVLLWHVADRWGYPDGDGVVVPVRLTHEVLAHMAFARRPTTSLALKALTERGLVSRRDDGLLVLRGEPPKDLLALRDAVS